MGTLRKLLIIALCSAVVAGATLFFLREYFLERKISEATEAFHRKTGGKIIIVEKAFNGMRQVDLKNIRVLNPHGDTVFTVGDVSVNISLLRILKRKPALSKLEASGINVTLIKNKEDSNYSFLLSGKKDKPAENKEKSGDYQLLTEALWDKLMDVSDVDVSLRKTKLLFKTENYERTWHIPLLRAQNGELHFSFENHEHLLSDKWDVHLEIKESEQAIKLKVKDVHQGNPSWIPYFDRDNSPKVSFRSFSASVQKKDGVAHGYRFESIADSLHFNYWRLAGETVAMPAISQMLDITIQQDGFTIDSTSLLKIGQLDVQAGALYKNSPSKQYALLVKFNQPSQVFFDALPTAVFKLFEGIKTKGTLRYELQFALDMNDPDHLIFESDMRGSNFSVAKYGKENFARINAPFVFDAYDGDRYVRSFLVGEGNAEFVALNDISSYLQYSVLTSEDPSFFYHRGFIEEAFRQSLSENIKAKRFARGGSTISMQLVKNVFLTREKTVARKLQEILAVWLIENCRLVSKERMFEIYLNAIEWGPGIYGIKEAGHFYFNKMPSQLNLAESIYLASIIPHPKFYRYSFDKTGKLRPSLQGYYKLISNRMLSKTWITPLDTFNLKAEVQLGGEALKYVMPADMLPADSVKTDTDEDFFN